MKALVQKGFWSEMAVVSVVLTRAEEAGHLEELTSAIPLGDNLVPVEVSATKFLSPSHFFAGVELLRIVHRGTVIGSAR